MGIYDFKVKDMNSDEVSLDKYQGKVLLIVNTATACGFTPQYKGLQELYDKYHGEGFEILDFPCNQFANQAPGTDSEIHDFCQLRYNTSFPQFAKIDVNGENESPLYTFLKSQRGGLAGGKIKWNFTKFLVNQKGEIIKRYAPVKTPEAIEKDIKALLGKN